NPVGRSGAEAMEDDDPIAPQKCISPRSDCIVGKSRTSSWTPWSYCTERASRQRSHAGPRRIASRNLTPHSPRRRPNPQLQEEFRHDSFLAPCSVCDRHLSDQQSQVGWYTWLPLRLRLASPEQAKPGGHDASTVWLPSADAKHAFRQWRKNHQP